MELALPVNLEAVALRQLVSDDYDAYIALERDSETKRFVGGPNQKVTAQILLELRRGTRDATLIAIADLQTNAYIGRCGLLPTGFDEIEMYCLVASSHRRKGIGKTIFAFLSRAVIDAGLSPVAIIDPENSPSRRLLESLGFRSDGPISFLGSYQNGHLRYVRGSNPEKT